MRTKNNQPMQSFDKIVNRRGTNCSKYDEMPNDDTIALWVADMDFETAPCVQDALKKRMEHGCFGYTLVPESYYQATIDWFAHRHGWHGIKREWFIYTSGVVPAVSAIIKAVTKPGAKVMTLTPAYNCFFSSIRNNGCTLEACALRRVGNRYEVDWDAFEASCADDSVKVFLLCNPHNPTGRVWTQEELHRMGETCKRHGVFVIADEIHCEFVRTSAYVPFMTASDAPCAVCLSPSKAFNIAGLQIANIIIKDDSVRRRVNRAININEVCDVNPFGVIALEAAYTAEGEQWLRELNKYIYANYDFARKYIAEHIPQWQVTEMEGTYLMWVRVDGDADELCRTLLDKANVYVNSGTMYDHSEEGKHFIRINLATQRDRLAEGLRRISESLYL